MNSRDLSAFGGAAFLTLAAATFVLLTQAMGTMEADAPPETVAAALREDPLLGLAVTASALAGTALLAFGSSLRAALPRLPMLAQHAVTLWAASWFLTSAILFAAGDLASHFLHAAGAKTTAVLAYDVMVGPHNAILGGLVAGGAWWAARGAPEWPAWHRRLSAAAAVGALVGGSLLAVAFAGLIAVSLLPAWLVANALLLPARAITTPITPRPPAERTDAIEAQREDPSGL